MAENLTGENVGMWKEVKELWTNGNLLSHCGQREPMDGYLNLGK